MNKTLNMICLPIVFLILAKVGSCASSKDKIFSLSADSLITKITVDSICFQNSTGFFRDVKTGKFGALPKKNIRSLVSIPQREAIYWAFAGGWVYALGATGYGYLTNLSAINMNSFILQNLLLESVVMPVSYIAGWNINQDIVIASPQYSDPVDETHLYPCERTESEYQNRMENGFKEVKKTNDSLAQVDSAIKKQSRPYIWHQIVFISRLLTSSTPIYQLKCKFDIKQAIPSFPWYVFSVTWEELMSSLAESAKVFLSGKNIAIAGISREGPDQTGKMIYDKFKESGYKVFAIHPSAGEELHGEPCYSDLISVPEPLDGAFFITPPKATEDLVDQALEAKIPRIWMHKSLGNSVSQKAVEKCRNAGVMVIDGGCPMMFLDPVDFGHKCLKFILSATGRIPK